MDPANAVARIELHKSDTAKTLASWGTGFLVDKSGLILTAGHVVRDETGAPRPGTVTVCFKGKSPLDAQPTGDWKKGHDDWALLQCDGKALSDITPISLQPLERNQYGVPWRTFGYPKLYGLEGGFLSGLVRGNKDKIDVYSNELEGDPELAEGLSGSPCLVYDVAVGVVLSVKQYLNKNVGRTVTVLPMHQIARECGKAIQFGGVPLPYENQFEAAAQGLEIAARRMAASVLHIPMDPPETLPARLARAMLLGGHAATVNVICALGSYLDDKRAEELWRAAESLWVDANAARQLSGVLLDDARKPSAASLNGRLAQTAKHYLHRAYGETEEGVPAPWPSKSVVVSREVGEPIAENLVAEIKETLKAEFRWEPEVLAQNLQTHKPITAIIVDRKPRRDVLAAINKNLKNLRVVFLTHPSTKTDLESIPEVEPLDPEIAAGEEERVNNAHSEAVEKATFVRKELAAKLREERKKDAKVNHG
jgi:hypothetical protein